MSNLSNSNKPVGSLTYGQVSAYLNVSTRTVRRWVRNGTIPHLRISSQVRFDPDEIAAFIAGCAVPSKIGGPS